MRRTVNGVYNFFDFQIFEHGDGLLPPNENPFMYESIQGCSFIVQSMPPHQLSWSYLRGAAEGMKETLCQRGRYYQNDFDIYDSDDGLVGKGRLSATSLSNNVTVDSLPETS